MRERASSLLFITVFNFVSPNLKDFHLSLVYISEMAIFGNSSSKIKVKNTWIITSEERGEAVLPG